MEVRRRAVMALCVLFVLLHTVNARAECYTKECVYALPIGFAIGGAVSVVGSSASIGDASPDSSWHHIGYVFGVFNFLSGGGVVVAGMYADEADEQELLYGLGGAQVGLGALAIFTAALAEAHFDAVEELRGRHGFRLGPMVDPETAAPSGATLQFRF